MTADIYAQLARFLDQLPAGFPPSPSGVELRILRHLFTPEEARIAMCLTLISEEAPVIAIRAGLPLAETESILAELSRKRLIYAFREPEKPTRYMAEQFVIGFWEGQVNRLDREMVEMFEEYLPVYASAGIWQKTPQLRTIPVKASIPVGEDISSNSLVLPYEQIDTIIAGRTKFAVMNCVCRQETQILGHACDKPMETCMAFDTTADFVVRDGRGRYVDKTEALAIIRRAEEAGLVLQPGNDQTPGNLCMCCGCCCGALRMLKHHPQPARVAASPFIAALNPDACAGCGSCLDRCQMDALSLPTFTVRLDLDRCIGCGLCVTACPSDALSLVRKAPEQQPAVPQTMVQMTVKLAQSRGQLGPLQMAKLAARTAIDRLRAAAFRR